MFIIAMAMIVAGYTLLYYGVSMWQAYQKDPQDVTAKTAGYGGIPLSVLFGFSTGSKSGSTVTNSPYSTPPFNLGGETSTVSDTTAAATTGTSATGGVQNV